MSRRHMKAFGVILAAELAVLVVVVMIVLDGTQPTQFPPSVPVSGEMLATSDSSVPVAVTLKLVGTTKTAALRSRGGQAVATRLDSDTGFVTGRRRTTTPG